MKRRRLWPLAIGLFAAVGVAQIMAWLFDRAPVVIVDKYDVPEQAIVPPGLFRYSVHFRRRAVARTFVQRWLIDSLGFRHDIDPLPSSMPTTGLEEPQVSEAKIPVPADMPSGVTQACFQVTWRVQGNPIHYLWPITGKETCIPFLVNNGIPSLSLDFGDAGPW